MSLVDVGGRGERLRLSLIGQRGERTMPCGEGFSLFLKFCDLQYFYNIHTF